MKNMISLIHGDNLVASRNLLNEKIRQAKAKGIKDVVRLDGEKIDVTDLKQALESSSLFASDRLVIIENLFTRKQSKLKADLINNLLETDPKSELVIWESKAVSPAQLKKLPPSAKIHFLKIGPKIFQFLDSIAPGNHREMLLLMHGCITQESEEMVFYMLVRRVSVLIIAVDLGKNGLDGMQGWQKDRLIRQANRFSLPQLLSLHERLYETDKKIKTGRNILPLSSLLDLIIADI